MTMSGQYEIEFRHSIKKDLKKIPSQFLASIIRAIENLGNDPYPSGVVKITDTDSYYRIRVGEYRVIYEILKNDHKIVVLYIRHRKNAYLSNI